MPLQGSLCADHPTENLVSILTLLGPIRGYPLDNSIIAINSSVRLPHFDSTPSRAYISYSSVGNLEGSSSLSSWLRDVWLFKCFRTRRANRNIPLHCEQMNDLKLTSKIKQVPLERAVTIAVIWRSVGGDNSNFSLSLADFLDAYARIASSC